MAKSVPRHPTSSVQKRVRWWLETIVGGALIGMVAGGFLIVYNRMKPKQE